MKEELDALLALTRDEPGCSLLGNKNLDGPRTEGLLDGRECLITGEEHGNGSGRIKPGRPGRRERVK